MEALQGHSELCSHISGHVLHTLEDSIFIVDVFLDIPETPIHGPSPPESRVFITGQCLHPLEVIRAHPELL